MPKAPRVSVVMPVFDGARFLAEAIESVLAQSLSDLELLVVDDGSSDGSAAIAARYAAADSRVHVLSLPRTADGGQGFHQGCLDVPLPLFSVRRPPPLVLPLAPGPRPLAPSP